MTDLALSALVMGGLAVGLDATVLSVALPTLAGRLHASESDLQWFSSGYLLVLAAAMLPLGLLGDRYGRKKVLLGSFALELAETNSRMQQAVAGMFQAVADNFAENLQPIAERAGSDVPWRRGPATAWRRDLDRARANPLSD